MCWKPRKRNKCLYKKKKHSWTCHQRPPVLMDQIFLLEEQSVKTIDSSIVLYTWLQCISCFNCFCFSTFSGHPLTGSFNSSKSPVSAGGVEPHISSYGKSHCVLYDHYFVLENCVTCSQGTNMTGRCWDNLFIILGFDPGNCNNDILIDDQSQHTSFPWVVTLVLKNYAFDSQISCYSSSRNGIFSSVSSP